MTPNPDTSRARILGCFDPDGASLQQLARWSDNRVATTLCEQEAFQLWGWGSLAGRVHALRSSSLCGLLCGDLYRNPGGQADPPGSGVSNLVAAYNRDGPACVLRLVGQFSTFLWDCNRRELILFRDDSGARSIYFKQLSSGAFAFSDDLDLLVASPLVEKRLARGSLHELLRFLDVSAPNTIYEGVHATEPGVLLRVRDGRIHCEHGLHPPESAPPKSLTIAADGLERRLADAVSARISPDDNTVVFLSGGVDSSLICALAAAEADVKVEALTVGFAERELDESDVARRVARHLGVRHRVLSFPMTTYREAFERLTARVSYPSADPAGVPTLLAFEAAREHGTCALDGTGADTLLGVMPARHQRVAVQFGTLLPRPIRRFSARALKAVPKLRDYAPLVDFDDPEETLIRWRGWQRKELELLCNEEVSLAHTKFYRLFSQFPRDAHLPRYSTLIGNLPDDRIHQASAITGVEVRFPYFDPGVIDWVSCLDLDLRYHPAEPKRVLKAVLDRYVPRSMWDTPKHGFDFPFVSLMLADDCALVRQYLDPAVTSRWGLFDQNELDATANSFIRGNRRSAFADQSPAFRIWVLVVLFAWLENHYRHL
jgi:asparagine synthase (glutamine-hydrolysing)